MRSPSIWLVVVVCFTVSQLAGCGSNTPSDTASSDTSPDSASSDISADPAYVYTDLGEKWSDHTQGLPFVLSYEKGLEVAKSQDKPAMMFVTTTWCGWCKKLSEENFNDPDVAKLLESFVCVIVDGDTEKDAKTQLGATGGYPHLVFLSQDGNKIGECLGYLPVKDFKPIVEAALAQVDSGQPAAAGDDAAE